MRRILTLGTAVAVTASLAAAAAAAPSAHDHEAAATAATAGAHAENMLAKGHAMPTAAQAIPAKLAAQLQLGRLATAKYTTNLALAKKNGYGVITQMIPDMGWHFMNPKITTFDVRKPPILVYGKHGSTWQLVAFEWVFPAKPKSPPLPGATYGAFGAACHYKDGTFVAQEDESACAPKSPQSGAAFNFWHPDLVTLHVWAWYPNPDGVYSGMNPLMHPFNNG
jgi:hypothetical protein